MLTMTELYDWVDYHIARFSSWKTQMSGLSERSKRYSDQRMLDEFKDFSLSELKRATDRMATWDTRVANEQHIRTIARLIKEDRRERAQFHSKEDAPSCPWCLGSGIACLYAGCYPVTRERYGEQSRWERVGVPCFCDASRVCNHWLREWHDKIPNGMEHRSRLTEEQRQAVELGPDWFAAPEWQVADKGGRMEF